MLKWERLNADDTVEVPADMTRLTLDTIARCGFDYRFNSFYRDTPHPFVLAMLKKVRADQKFMVETVRHILEERRSRACWGRSTTSSIGCPASRSNRLPTSMWPGG